MKNLISILTPTHNRASKLLPQTIRSIQNQKEEGFFHEHIIVDNCSTDKTEKVVKEFAQKDKRIKYVKNSRNLGAADALNVAFKKSKGEYIVPLDDDDILPLSSLQIRFDFHSKNSKAQWSYGRSLFIDQDNRLLDSLLEFSLRFKPEKSVFLSLWGRCFIPNGTVTINRKALEKVGLWDENIKTQDYDMWLKLASKGVKPYLIDSYLCLYRVHPEQVHNLQKNDGTYAQEREHYADLYKRLLSTKKSR